MSAFDDLQRQLLESVSRGAREHPEGAGSAGARASRRWRPPRSKRALLLLAAPFLFVAAATAATIVARSTESPADALTARVLKDTAGAPACRSVGPRKAALSDEAPDPRITAVLPRLASPPPIAPGPRVLALAERNSGGAVLARTIRSVRLPGGIELIVYVAHGQGPFTLRDPRRCLTARLDRLAQLRPRPRDPLRLVVARTLRAMPEIDPGLQSLTLIHRQTGSEIDGGGASIPLSSNEKALPTGILFSGSSCLAPRPGMSRCSPVFYGGIVAPRVAYITVQPPPRARARRGRAARLRVAVVEGLFAFTLPRNSPPEMLVQRAADGRALAAGPVR
jgi:hypothetical protein